MKKNVTRLIALALIALMCLALLPMAAFAEVPETGAPQVELVRNIINGQPGEISGLTEDMVYANAETGWAWADAPASGVLEVAQSCTTYFCYRGLESDETRKSSVTIYDYVTVTPSADEGGSVTPSDVQYLLKDSETDSVTFSFAAEQGYELEDVKVDGVSVGAQSSYTVSDASAATTVAASFKLSTPAVTQYAVSFDAKGGTPQPPEQTVTAGQAVTLPTGLNRENFDLVGWSTTDGGSAISGASYTPSESCTLYALWQAQTQPDTDGTSGGSTKTASARANVAGEGNASLEAALNAKAVELGTTRANTRNVTYYVWSLWDNDINDKLSAAEMSDEAAKGNLNFTAAPPSWFTTANCDVYAYLFNDSGSLTAISYTGAAGGYSFPGTVLGSANPATLVLLAVPRVSNFTFQFDANTGTGTMDPVTLPETTAFYAPGCDFTAPANKHFAHWNTAANDQGYSYAPGELVAKNLEFHELRLYAIWEDDASSANTGTAGASASAASDAIPANKISAQKTALAGSGAADVKSAVYDVTPCWGGNSANPMTSEQIAAAIQERGYISFSLDYPAGSNSSSHTFSVYHYNATTGALTSVTSFDTGSNLLVLGTEFSPYLTLAAPKAGEGGSSSAALSVVISPTAATPGTELTAIVSPTGASATYQWMANSVSIDNAVSDKYTVKTEDVGKQIICVVSSGSNMAVSNAVTPTSTSSSSTAKPAKPTTPTVDKHIIDGKAGIIKGLDTSMEYLGPRTSTWKPCTGATLSVADGKEGTYYFRYKAVGTTPPSDAVPVTIRSYYTVTAGVNRGYGTLCPDTSEYTAEISKGSTLAISYVEKGGTYNLTIHPARRYYIYNVLEDGEYKGHGQHVTIKNVRAHHLIVVNFAENYSPRTADDSNIPLWTTLCCVSLAGFGAVWMILRKRKEE